MKTILLLSVLLFALFGFSEFLHLLKLYIIFPKRKMHSCLTVSLQNDTAEQQLYYVCEQLNWYGDKFADIILPDCKKLDNATYNRCQEIAKKYGVELLR